MAAAPPSLTLDRVRGARDRIRGHVDREMRDLGADPAAFAQDAISLSGLEWLERWLQPEIPPPPPVAVLFGAEWTRIAPSRVTLVLEPGEWMFNPFGAVYGGLTSTVLDIAMAPRSTPRCPPAPATRRATCTPATCGR